MNNKLAKPAGISYTDHTTNVVREGNAWLAMHPALVKKYAQFFNELLIEKIPSICLEHDLGKLIDPWQTACVKDFEAFSAWQKENKNGNFEAFKRACPKLAGKHLREAGVRHELYSPLAVKNRELPLPDLVAIMAHHGKLSHSHEKRWQVCAQPQSLQDNGEAAKMLELTSHITREFDFIQAEFGANGKKFEKMAKELLRYTVLRGVLQIADQRASALEETDETPEYQPFFYKWNADWTPKPVQEKVLNHSEELLLLLKATTGAGKTDAALLWAKMQIEAGNADHLIIAMPTRFTANALSIMATKQMSNTGLYHSSAWNHRYFEKVEKDPNARKYADAEHKYSRILLAPTTVCTIDHLLMSMTLLREDHHQILTQLGSSCLVIDEADFYDSFVQANLIELLKLLRVWKVPVLIMSASLPDSSVELYKKSGFEISGIVDGNSDVEYDRERFRLESFEELNGVEKLADLIETIYKGEAVIVYVNTVQRAIDLYTVLEKRLQVPLLVYHSAFTETDKTKKEAEILKLLGKEAWEKGKPEGIVILTQIGEMSINISATHMVSDLCPIDRLIQRAGRLQRFSDKACGKMTIVKQLKTNRLTGEEEWNALPYVKSLTKKVKDFTPIQSLVDTEAIFKNAVGEIFTNKRLDEYNNCIYRELAEFDSDARSNAKMLPDFIKKNMLISAKSAITEDMLETTEWSSRNIEEQAVIFTHDSYAEFPLDRNTPISYRRFQNLKMKYGVQVRNYEIDVLRGYKYGQKVAEMKIDEKEIFLNGKIETIFILLDEHYSFEAGFNRKATERIGIKGKSRDDIEEQGTYDAFGSII